MKARSSILEFKRTRKLKNCHSKKKNIRKSNINNGDSSSTVLTNASSHADISTIDTESNNDHSPSALSNLTAFTVATSSFHQHHLTPPIIAMPATQDLQLKTPSIFNPTCNRGPRKIYKELSNKSEEKLCHTMLKKIENGRPLTRSRVIRLGIHRKKSKSKATGYKIVDMDILNNSLNNIKVKH